MEAGPRQMGREKNALFTRLYVSIVIMETFRQEGILQRHERCAPESSEQSQEEHSSGPYQKSRFPDSEDGILADQWREDHQVKVHPSSGQDGPADLEQRTGVSLGSYG